MESIPLEERREQEQTERSKCDGFVIALVPNFLANSRTRMALQNHPKLRQDVQMIRFMFPHWSFTVCVTLIKVAFCSRGNCWKSWKLKDDCWQTASSGINRSQEWRDQGDISECLLSIIIVQKSYIGFHGQMCFLFFLKLNSFSTLGIFFSLSPHFSSLSSSAQLFFISLFDQILISRHVKCIWPILISESSLPNRIP